MKHNPFMYAGYLNKLEPSLGYSVYSLMIRAVGQTFFHIIFMRTAADSTGEEARNGERLREQDALEQIPEYIKAKEHLDHFFRSMAFLRIHCLDNICTQRIQHFGKKVHHGYPGRDWNNALIRFQEEPMGKAKHREAAEHPHVWDEFQAAMHNLERHPVAARIIIKAIDPVHQRSVIPMLRSR